MYDKSHYYCKVISLQLIKKMKKINKEKNKKLEIFLPNLLSNRSSTINSSVFFIKSFYGQNICVLHNLKIKILSPSMMTVEGGAFGGN